MLRFRYRRRFARRDYTEHGRLPEAAFDIPQRASRKSVLCYEVKLYDDLLLIGSVGACRLYALGRDVLMVLHSEVHPSLRRRGYGTMLYNEMSKIACRQKLPLSSSHASMRSALATSFWEKQRRAGLARVFGHADNEIFILNDPCEGI